MSIETEIVKIQLRRGTSVQFYTNNPILSAGEAGYEVDTGVLKLGDGTTDYRNLMQANQATTDAIIATAQYQQGEITALQSATSDLATIRNNIATNTNNIATNTTNISKLQNRWGQNYKWSAFSLTAGSQANHSFSVTNQSGRPYFLIISGDENPTTDSAWCNIWIQKNGTTIVNQICESRASSHNNPFAVHYLDTDVSIGATYTYNFIISQSSGTATYGEQGDAQSPQCSVFEI